MSSKFLAYEPEQHERELGGAESVQDTVCLAEDVIQGGMYENADLVGICLDVISVCWLGSAQKVFLAVS